MNLQRNGRGSSCRDAGAHRMHTVGSYGAQNGAQNGADISPEKGWVKNGAPLATVYPPYQSWRKILDAASALNRGTIFAELDKPFCPCGQTM